MAERITRESWDVIAEEIINIVEYNRDFGSDEFTKRELEEFLTGEDIINVMDERENGLDE